MPFAKCNNQKSGLVALLLFALALDVLGRWNGARELMTHLASSEESIKNCDIAGQYASKDIKCAKTKDGMKVSANVKITERPNQSAKPGDTSATAKEKVLEVNLVANDPTCDCRVEPKETMILKESDFANYQAIANKIDQLADEHAQRSKAKIKEQAENKKKAEQLAKAEANCEMKSQTKSDGSIEYRKVTPAERLDCQLEKFDNLDEKERSKAFTQMLAQARGQLIKGTDEQREKAIAVLSALETKGSLTDAQESAIKHAQVGSDIYGRLRSAAQGVAGGNYMAYYGMQQAQREYQMYFGNSRNQGPGVGASEFSQWNSVLNDAFMAASMNPRQFLDRAGLAGRERSDIEGIRGRWDRSQPGANLLYSDEDFFGLRNNRQSLDRNMMADRRMGPQQQRPYYGPNGNPRQPGYNPRAPINNPNARYSGGRPPYNRQYDYYNDPNYYYDDYAPMARNNYRPARQPINQRYRYQ